MRNEQHVTCCGRSDIIWVLEWERIPYTDKCARQAQRAYLWLFVVVPFAKQNVKKTKSDYKRAAIIYVLLKCATEKKMHWMRANDGKGSSWETANDMRILEICDIVYAALGFVKKI